MLTLKSDQLLIRQRDVLLLGKPTKRNYLSVFNYLWNEKFIPQSEASVYNRSDDLVVLTAEQDSPIQGFVEEYIFSFTPKWFQVNFQTCAIWPLFNC